MTHIIDTFTIGVSVSLPAYAMNVSSFPEVYEQWLVSSLFKPWADIVLDRAHLSAGARVLDIACGTGIVARRALERLSGQAQVVGVDVSPQMLAVARTVEPRIDWRESNASALLLGDGEQFDVVLCHQGLQFFPDRPTAAREMKRVTARGGRVVVAVWKSLDETPFFRPVSGRRTATRSIRRSAPQLWRSDSAGAIDRRSQVRGCRG